MKQFLPSQIAGAAVGVGADLLSATLLVEVERALLDGKACLGITIDLLKCFNQMPRVPILAAFQKMGVAVHYVVALDGLFQLLRRVLGLSGDIGVQQWASITGVPEGCAMSTTAMLAVSSGLFPRAVG